MLAALLLGQFGAPLQGQASAVRWRTLASLADSRSDARGAVTLDSPDAFGAWWQRNTGNPAETAPRVDWMQDKVVACSAGRVPTGGYRFFVQSVRKANLNAVAITASLLTPPPESFVGRRPQRPVALVVVERSAPGASLAVIQREPRGGLVMPNDPYGYGPDVSPTPGGAYVSDPRTAVAFRTVTSGVNGGRRARQGLGVFDDAEALGRWWREATGNGPDTIPAGIDWLQQKALVVSVGSRPTGGYSVRVLGVRKIGGARAVVDALETRPPYGSFVSQALTSPFVIVAVPREPMDYSLSLIAR